METKILLTSDLEVLIRKSNELLIKGFKINNKGLKSNNHYGEPLFTQLFTKEKVIYN